MSDMGVEMDVFSTCRRCGVPVSKQLDEATPVMDSWVDITDGDACDDGVHEPLVAPQAHALMEFVNDVQINALKRVRAGRECRFVMETPDGRWVVSILGTHGSLPFTHLVHPHDVKIIEQ